MASIFLNFSTAGVNQHLFVDSYNHLQKKIQEVANAFQYNSRPEYAALLLPAATKHLAASTQLALEKQKLTPRLLIVIGIGGSNLGTIAIQEALFGKGYNELSPTIKIYYIETVDSQYIETIYRITENCLQKKETVFVTIITKSGTTTETIVNAQIFIELLERYYSGKYHDYIIAITEKNSPLWNIASQKKFSLLEIPEHVGGRFSVFSNVTLFPLALLGVDIHNLLQGAEQQLKEGTTLTLNDAVMSALIKYHYYKEGVVINDFFAFCVSLESLGKWYRQLIAESLGKKSYATSKETGIMPTVSLGTTDLHSIGQLYLAGPRDKFVTFVSCQEPKKTFRVPRIALFDTTFPLLQEKTLSTLMKAILESVKKVYLEQKRPFYSLDFTALTPYCIGQFMQMSMLETVYLAYLLEVNPFDQPDVELYKRETQRILKNE